MSNVDSSHTRKRSLRLRESDSLSKWRSLRKGDSTVEEGLANFNGAVVVILSIECRAAGW